MLEHEPNHADALNGLGNIRETQGDLDAAAAAFARAAEAGETWAVPHKNLARVYATLERGDAAITSFRNALALDPQDTDSMRDLAALLIDADQFVEARELLDARHAFAPDDAETEFQLGNLWRSQGHLEEALDHLQRARDLLPEAPELHTNLGVVLQQLGRLDEATAAHRQAIALDPTFERALTNLGHCLITSGDYSEAVATFERVVTMLPRSGRVAQNLAHAFRHAQRYDEAIRWFDTAIELDPALIGAHNGLGNCYREISKYERAARAYNQASSLDPRNAEILYNLAIPHVDMGALDEALAVADRAIEQQPDAGWTHLARGKALDSHARYEEARAAYERGVELDPGNISGLMSLAVIYGRLWQTDKAIATYNQILEIDPQNDEAFGFLVNEVLSLGVWDTHRRFTRVLLDKISAATPDPMFDNVNIFNLQALPISYQLVARAARRRSMRITEATAEHRKACRFSHDKSSRERLRIGFMLPYIPIATASPKRSNR